MYGRVPTSKCWRWTGETSRTCSTLQIPQPEISCKSSSNAERRCRHSITQWGPQVRTITGELLLFSRPAGRPCTCEYFRCGNNVRLLPTAAKRLILQAQGFPILQCFTILFGGRSKAGGAGTFIHEHAQINAGNSTTCALPVGDCRRQLPSPQPKRTHRSA